MTVTETCDLIKLWGLSAVGNHGVYEFERSGSQVFTADLTLTVDSRLAAQTDDVDHTVDYSAIADGAIAILTGPPVYLLETLAQNLATMALEHPRVQAVEVTIHKPMAPIRHQFTDVSVTVKRDRAGRDGSIPADTVIDEAQPTPSPVSPRPSPASRVVIALGSNQGDSVALLTRAVEQLMALPGVEIDDVSPLVLTRPVLVPGQAPQSNYLNAVVVARTTLTPPELLAATQGIEESLGRVRGERWGARTVDIDLIDFGGVRGSWPGLELPHPRAHLRAFVLYPWSLVAPGDVFAGGRRVAELADSAVDRGGILATHADWLIDPQGAVASSAKQPSVLRMPPPPPSPSPSPSPAGPTVVSPVRNEPPEQPRSEVAIRGNRVTLQPVGGDYVFQRLLRTETSAAAQSVTPAVAPRSSAPAPRGILLPGVGEEADVPTRIGEVQLPNWRTISPSSGIRIVDAVESAETQAGSLTDAPAIIPPVAPGSRRRARPSLGEATPLHPGEFPTGRP